MEAGRRIPWPANPQIVGELRTMFWHEKAPDASGVVGIGPDSRWSDIADRKGKMHARLLPSAARNGHAPAVLLDLLSRNVSGPGCLPGGPLARVRCTRDAYLGR